MLPELAKLPKFLKSEVLDESKNPRIEDTETQKNALLEDGPLGGRGVCVGLALGPSKVGRDLKRWSRLS